MKVLALDTSTSLATVALTDDARIVAESVFTCDRSLSARLVPEIERLLTLGGLSVSDVDLFAASIGPGSFTGVRCGVATIQGLALATGKPCTGFSSLAMLAMNLSLNSCPVCTLLDARKNEVYAALYAPFAQLPVEMIPDCVLPPERLLDLVCEMTGQNVVFTGDGAIRYQRLISDRMGDRALFPSFSLNTARAANGAVLALNLFQRGDVREPSQLLPVYLRASDAEMMKQKHV